MGQKAVGPVGDGGALLPVDHHLPYYLVDKVVLLVYYVPLIAAVQHVGPVYWVLLQKLLVPLQ